MKLPVKKGYLIVLIPTFFVYFYSESVLRQGAVSNIDPKKFNIETIVAELPGSVRDAISYKIHYGQLQDEIQKAVTDKEKAFALCNMADFIKEPEKRVELFDQVLIRYPSLPESARAYTFFLRNQDTKTQVTDRQFQDYVLKLMPLEQYYIWTIGLSKLVSLKISDRELMNFLLPLLKLPPAYRDYSGLYKQLSEFAAKSNADDVYRQAVKLEEKCYELPLMEMALVEQAKIKKENKTK